MKSRGYYFGAGPAMLPNEILIEAQQNLLNWNGQGMSILEVGHRTEAFMQLLRETEVLVRENLNVPDSYAVLFIGQPARLQFSNIPLNFLNEKDKAAYIVTGTWSQMAFDEAKRLLPFRIDCLGSSKEQAFTTIPHELETCHSSTKYLYFTPNETIHGVAYEPPVTYQNYPWVADMTSCLFSQPIDVTRYGLIFAGAQKNIANAGLSLVIVRKDWLKEEPDYVLPQELNYRVHEQQGSLSATPPTFNCFIANRMMHWIKAQGGIKVIGERNLEKAHLLYDFIDASKQYQTFVDKNCRSMINVCFTTGSVEEDTKLLKKAEENGLYGLKGHRVLGGLRASLYNAMPKAGVEKLIDFLAVNK